MNNFITDENSFSSWNHTLNISTWYYSTYDHSPCTCILYLRLFLYGREKKESIFRDISTGRSSISNKNFSRLSIDVHTPFQTHFIKELFIYLSTLVFLTIPQFFLIDNRSIKKVPPYNLDINYFSFFFYHSRNERKFELLLLLLLLVEANSRD